MVMLSPPGYLQAGTYDAVKDRQYLVTTRFYKSAADQSRARGGLLPDNVAWSAPLGVSGFNVTVGPFRAVIGNTFAANAGDYIVVSPQSELRTLAGSSPTTNRIDVIGVLVRDAFYSGAFSDADVVVIPGTPSAGTPAVPTLPAGFLGFYNLLVSANSTAPVVTDVRQRTALLNTPIPIFTQQMGQGGVNYGEQRIFPASGVMPPRHVLWGEDGAWHGQSPFVLDFGAYNHINSTADRAVATLAVPDPGYPYRLVFTGLVVAGFDGLNGWRFPVRDGVAAGGTILAATGFQTRDPDNSFSGDQFMTLGGSSQPLSGARTVTLWGQRIFGSGSQGAVTTAQTNVSAMVVGV